VLKRVEIVIDDDLVQEAIRRYHQADAREAVYLALRVLLSKDGAAAEQQEDEYDEFSDLSAWQRRPNSGTG
jgi:Arc/MetJ family transcription regulator